MRIAIVDESAGRAAVIAERLGAAGLSDTFVITERAGLLARIEALAPEVVLINLENPGRDMLEEYFAVSRALARPIAMFVDQSDAEATNAAIDAGVSAYVVDGLATGRIKTILDLAVRRFHTFAKLQAELDEARSALASRELVDKAKRILMKRRCIDEPAAYAMLRSHAMRSNRRIAEVAEAIVTAEEVAGGEP